MTAVQNPFEDLSTTHIAAGDTEAVFVPGHGMLGISFRHKGVEFLRRIDDLEIYAARNQTAGIPFLFPWANRLAGLQYEVEDRGVTLSAHSPVLRYDENGLPMHGMMWPHLAWTIEENAAGRISARYDWSHPKGLVIFPYPCQVTMTATVAPSTLTIETTLVATSDSAVPVSFGFHPYFGLPDVPRREWQVRLPEMRHLTLDARKIPTGASEPFPGLNAALGMRDFDDGFALLGDSVSLSIAAGDHRISVDLLEGFHYTQVFAPYDKDYLAFEPMTAPTNALISREGLRLVAPGETFRAVFRVRVD
jgi:aldose 1-epimerase